MYDLYISVILGFVLGITVIVVLHQYPGEPFDYSTDREINSNERESNEGEILGDKKEAEISTDQNEKLQNLLGISEAQVKSALKNSNKSSPDTINPVKIIEWIIFLSLLFGAFYFSNIATNGDLGRVLAGLFPREFKALGLKDYLEKYSTSTMQNLQPNTGLTKNSEL